MLRAPNALLANGETVTITRQDDATGKRGGISETDAGSATYPAIATKAPGTDSRRDGESMGAPTSVQLWDVLIFSATDPGVSVDDHLTTGTHTLQALGASYPRGAGAWQVRCQEVR